MNAQEYLKEIRKADQTIDRKLERLHELRARATAISSPDYSSERVQTSPSGDMIPRLLAEIDCLEREIDSDVDKFVDMKSDRLEAVKRINDADAIFVLQQRYFKYKTFDQIAEKMKCSTKTIQRIHKRALEKLDVQCIL